MSKLSIPSVRFKQNGVWIYLTSLKATDLVEFTKVAHFKNGLNPADQAQGYQREPVPAKAKAVAKYLHEGLKIMPTAIVLSSREGESNVGYNETRKEITLDSSKKLYIIDGQHRTEGFRVGIEKGWSELADVEMPVVIVQGLDKIEEMRQFRDINGNQKRVATGLVNMILTQIEAVNGEGSIDEKDRWKVIASHVINRLNSDENSPWKGLLIMPNESRPKRSEIEENPELLNTKIVSATSFYAAIRPIYDYLKAHHEYLLGSTIKEEAEALYGVLVEFWQAIKELCPDAFESPTEYVIQKTPGLFALNLVCKALLSQMHSGRREWVKAEFVKMLEDSEFITNAERWKVGDPEVDGDEGGEATKYGSMKGFSSLSKLIVDELDLAAKQPIRR